VQREDRLRRGAVAHLALDRDAVLVVARHR